MPRARLAVDLPPDTWIHAVSTVRPDTAFRVVTALPGRETGVALVEVAAGEPLVLVDEVREYAAVRDVSLLWRRGDTSLLQVETTDPILLRPVVEAGVPLETPFTVHDGTVTWVVTTSSGRLSALGEGLDDLGIDYRIEFVREEGRRETDPVLTDRQRETLLTAVELGYYESPRRASLTDVADELGIAKSTCSDTLHRAESNVVAWFVDGYLATDGTD